MGPKNKKSKKSKDEGGATDGAGDNGHGHGGKKVIMDSRFASVHSDPRFAKFTKHKSKVTIDSRFERMFTDKSFSSSTAQIDKRGKPKKDFQNPLKRYYRLEEDEEEKEKKSIGQVKNKDVKIYEESEESESESSESEEYFKKRDKQLSDLKLKNKSESESEEEEEEEQDDNDDDEEEEEEKVGDAAKDDNSSTDTTDSDEEYGVDSEEDIIPEENIPDIDKETHRLAVVNLDWSHVAAIDLYVLLSSFLTEGGQILSVAVHPSEFGIKRMEEEAVRGPVVLFDEEKEQNESDENEGEIDAKKLREYELSRLRYYYAVVECDSITTADCLYKSCDGIEFERSSNKLDLRFIPDSMEFKHPPRDVATEAPVNYEGLDFQTRSLQQSNIHLTWEDDEPQRAKALKRKFNGDQLAELELKEFLASDESETDEDGNDDSVEDQPQKKHKKQDLYRSLLQSGYGSDEDDGDGQDMEVTFNTGLEDISKHALEKKDKKSETVWEAQLRKRREKKMARKNSSKYSTDDESSDGDPEPREEVDDFFVEEPLVKASKEGKGKSDKRGKKNEETAKDDEAAASIAELELLLADNNGADTGLKGYNSKPKKVDANGKKGGREKRKREKVIHDEEKIPSADYDDPRFSALFTSPLFALDPTDPQFKRSATYLRQLAQKQRKGEQEVPGSKPAPVPSDDLSTKKPESLRSEEMSSKKEKYELSSLVRSIKMKSKQVQIPTNSKISGKFEKTGSKVRW